MKTAIIFGITNLLSGCVPMMMANTPYDRGSVVANQGQARATIIAKYGEPDHVSRVNDQEIDSYYSEADGPKPGERASFVAGGFLMDALYFGIPEVATIPEFVRMAEGPEYDVYTITYTADGKVLSEEITLGKG